MDRKMLSNCILCPRECGVDRTKGRIGYCRVDDSLVVARAALHMWEEPCISGDRGSGTVFFSGCSLGCVYCQNHCIAKNDVGKVITVERLAEIFLELMNKGANNINLVTPSHYVLQIIESIKLAKKLGLSIPIVYNSSGYEKASTIQLLEGLIDVYLPDMKYCSSELSEKYSNCSDYFDIATKSLDEMVRQVGNPKFDENGMMTKGVIVRHLILPGYQEDSKQIMKYLYETYGDTIYISIMNQYTPLSHVNAYPEINRKVTDKEYDEVVDYAIDLGVEQGFIQEGDTASESFIPDFNEEGV